VRREPGDERGMIGRRPALIDDLPEPHQVAGEQSLRVEPETRKDGGAVQAVGVGSNFLKGTIHQAKPEDGFWLIFNTTI
jgi:hypothetical protein